MTSSCDEIYSIVTRRIDDPKLMSLSNSDIEEIMNGWLHSAVSKPYIRRIFSTLSLDDEIRQITFELVHSDSDDADKDYAFAVIAVGMAIEWLEPQVNSTLNTAQMFGSNKEGKWYSQQQHLSVISQQLSDMKIEQRKLIRDRGYMNNSYLGGD